MQSEQERFQRLRWRCRRGLLELDLWLGRFAESQLGNLSPDECNSLEALLIEADADILAWLEGRQGVPGQHRQIIERVRAAV